MSTAWGAFRKNVAYPRSRNGEVQDSDGQTHVIAVIGDTWTVHL